MAQFGSSELKFKTLTWLIPFSTVENYYLDNKIYNFLPINYRYDKNFCNAEIPLYGGNICANWIIETFGEWLDKDIDNMERKQVYVSNIPAGQSYKIVLHYFQLAKERTLF